ncbi:hypothetical protein ACWIID_14490 [Streptomyces phaeochromogenes]
MAVHHRIHPRRITVERICLDHDGFPQGSGEFEKPAADSVVLAPGQDSDLSLLQGVPEPTVDHATVAGRGKPRARAPGDLGRG